MDLSFEKKKAGVSPNTQKKHTPAACCVLSINAESWGKIRIFNKHELSHGPEIKFEKGVKKKNKQKKKLYVYALMVQWT